MPPAEFELGLLFVFALRKESANRRGETLGEGVDDQVRLGVVAGDDIVAVQVREQIVQVHEAHLGVRQDP